MNWPLHPPPAVIDNRYLVTEVLDRGPAEERYGVIDGHSGRHLVLRWWGQMPKPAADRFWREVEVLVQLSHPNVRRVYSAGLWRGRCYVTTDPLQGISLRLVLRSGRLLPVVSAARLFGQAALGLAAAHDVGLVHGEVEPGNLLLHDGNARLQVVGFGLARSRARSCDPPDPRSDIHGLGVSMWEALVGRSVEVLDPGASRLLPEETPAAMLGLLMRMVDPAPRRRPGSCLEVATVLGDCIAGGRR